MNWLIVNQWSFKVYYNNSLKFLRIPNGSYFEISSYLRNVSSFIKIICFRVYFIFDIFISYIWFPSVLCVILQCQSYGLTFCTFNWDIRKYIEQRHLGYLEYLITYYLYCMSHMLGKKVSSHNPKNRVGEENLVYPQSIMDQQPTKFSLAFLPEPYNIFFQNAL